MNAAAVPTKTRHSTTGPNSESGDLVGRCPLEDETYIVWSSRIHRPDLFSVEELGRIAGVVEVANFSDGSVYRLSAKGTPLPGTGD